MRYGLVPQNASGDYDSDGWVNEQDFRFFHECLCRCGDFSGGNSPFNAPPAPTPLEAPCDCPGMNAGPGCRFADFDADGDVDCRDWNDFIDLYTGPESLVPCDDAPPIPTVSQWGAIVMALLLLCGFTLIFSRRSPDSIRLPHR